MIGPLQQRLLRMMKHGDGITAAELHKALIRDFGDKGQSYSTVLSVLRNLAKRRPDLLVSVKEKQQLVFTLQVPLEKVFEDELIAYVNSLNWNGSSMTFLKAISRLPRIPAGVLAAINRELAPTKS